MTRPTPVHDYDGDLVGETGPCTECPPLSVPSTLKKVRYFYRIHFFTHVFLKYAHFSTDFGTRMSVMAGTCPKVHRGCFFSVCIGSMDFLRHYVAY